jgi:uncharacterized protein
MPPDLPIIDVNITLGQWPMRRVPCDDRKTLVAKLKSHNVIEVWAGSYDGLFNDDLTEVNNRLAASCQAHPDMRLRPFGELNPLAPAWKAELDRCHEAHRMPGIRLHPNYHGYALDHPNFRSLVSAAAERKLIVQLAIVMEDARMMHPLLRVPPVDISPLARIVAETPGVKIVLLNALATISRNDKLSQLLEAGNVFVEISMLEGVGGIENLLKNVPLQKVLFGSHAPSFYFEAATLKLKESPLPAGHVAAITHQSARRLLPA